MLRQAFLPAAFLSLFFSIAPLHTAHGADVERPRLSASGEGYVEATPDIVVIELTLSHTAKTLSEAKRQVDEIGNAVIRAANANGVKGDDLQASKIQAAPEYDWQNGQRTLRGQQVNRQFLLRLRDIERYGALVQALTDAQVTQINGIRTEFSKQEQLENEALKKAIANVRGKADMMASACNSRIAGIASLAESGGAGHAPQPYEMRAAKAMQAGDAAGGDNLKIGAQRIFKSVDAVFFLESAH